MKLAPLPSPRCTRSRDSGRARLSRGGARYKHKKKIQRDIKMFECWGGEALLIKTLSAGAMKEAKTYLIRQNF